MGTSFQDSPKDLKIWRSKGFALYWFTRIFNTLAYQMLAVVVGWQIYELSGSVFYLGLVGLAQFFPLFAFTLAAGHVADGYNRRIIYMMCQFVESIGAITLAAGSYHGWMDKEHILGILVLMGIARAFERPAMQAMLPGLVPVQHFSRAVALNASSQQTATIIGPAIGGLLYVAGPACAYSAIGLLFLIAGVFLLLIADERIVAKKEPWTYASLFAGVAFIRSKPALLGAVSLDLFAVLLGGATALLPFYAKEILFVGPAGLGTLLSSPAVGALLMSIFLTHNPLKKNAGKFMFAACIVFGLATVGFAVSSSFVVSLIMLGVLGAANIISVVVRHSLVQLGTPDAMRGRVSAVNMLFIGTSNQLGEFESGLTAAWLGVVPSVMLGGVGTIIVAILWMRWFPELKAVDALEIQELVSG
jgi:MFS family permease